MRPLRVLDLFAGLEGWSEPFRERDHDVISVDLDPRFDVSLEAHEELTERFPQSVVTGLTVGGMGFAVDDQESELGVNCIAFPIFLESAQRPAGAISLAALVHRTPIAELVAWAGEIRAVIDAHLGPVTR